MKRSSWTLLAVAITAVLLAHPGQAQNKPKGKATPPPVPSEMPTFAGMRVKLGQAFMQKKNYRQAEMEFRAATRIDPSNYAAAVGLADAMYMRGNLREALPEYQRALRLVRPDYAQAIYAEASKLAAQSKYRQAIHHYRRVAHINPEAGELVNKGVLAQQSGDLAGAKKAYEEAIKLDEDYADAYYKLAGLSYDAKDYLTAIDLLEKAAAADPGDGLIYYKLGNAYYHFQGMNPKGEKYNFYRQWDRKERDEKWKNWCLTKAVAAYHKADSLFPGDFDTLFNLGNAEFYLGHAVKAVQALERAVHVAPDDVDAHHMLGNAYYMLAKDLPGYNKAIHQFRVAKLLDPSRYEIEYNLGYCYFRKARIRPKPDQYEITPENSKFYYTRGGSYHSIDMLTHARKHFTSYLAQAPSDAKAREEIEKLMKEIAQEAGRSIQGH